MRNIKIKYVIMRSTCFNLAIIEYNVELFFRGLT